MFQSNQALHTLFGSTIIIHSRIVFSFFFFLHPHILIQLGTEKKTENGQKACPVALLLHTKKIQSY